MTLIIITVSALIAGIIQRVTGLGFVLVLIGPAVLTYGPVEGVTLAVLLAVIASLCALPQAWREVDWRRSFGLLATGLLAAPLGVLTVRALPDTTLQLLIAALAVFALLAHRIGGLAPSLRGQRGIVVAGAVAGYLHASSGLSGPPLAALAVGDSWDQRSFAASAQVILLGYGLLSVALRGLPSQPAPEILLLSGCTAAGVLAGTLLGRRIPAHIARVAMLVCAWAGAGVMAVRGMVSVLG